MSDSSISEKKVTASTARTVRQNDEENEKEEGVNETVAVPAAPEGSTYFVPEVKSKPIIYRTKLPAIMGPCNVSMWSFLRFGKDMTKLSFPIEMYEPLGNLQVMCEELEYSDLLDQAIKQKDPLIRMIKIACFAISRYASTNSRGQRKPFNPLEGETYECKRDDMGWTFIAEQVSHHPPVTACYAKGRGWKWWQSAFCNVAFCGKWIEAVQKTPVDVILSPHRERYTWNKVVTSLYNVLSSSPKYFDHQGRMAIKCSNGIACKMNFKKISGANKHEVEGMIQDNAGRIKYTLFGKWSEALYTGPEKKECVWTASNHKLPPQATQYYGFTQFALSLNELTSELTKQLPPTDTRFRPDQRSLENGKINEAQVKKTQLEESQRDRRKKREFKAKWFKKDEKQYEWNYSDNYWEARKNCFQGINFEKLW